jgi:hypothetical protein
MYSDSLLHIDKSIVFRETFHDAQSVANNRYADGRLSTSGIVFKNGKCIITNNSSQIVYNKVSVPQSHSFRCIVSFQSFTGIIAGGNGGHQFWGQITSSTSITNEPFNNQTTWTLSNPLILNTIYELVFVETSTNQTLYINGVSQGTITCGYAKNYGFRDINGSGVLSGDGMKNTLYLVEIYDRALSASEVSLLYKQSLYIDPSKQLPLLLDFNSTRGILEDTTGLNTLTNTNATIQKIGKVYSSYFNGGTTNIKTVNNINLSQNIVFSCWFKNSRNTAAGTSLFGNTKTYFAAYGGTYVLTSNATNTAFTTGIVDTLNKWTHVVVFLNETTGACSFYFNGAFNVNGASGTPTANQNLIFYVGGGGANGVENFYGYISIFQLYQGIMNPSQFVAQLYNSQKGQFNI